MQVRFASDQEFIEALSAELSQDPVDFEVKSVRVEEDPSVLGFDFETIAVLIGLASDLFLEEPLVPLLVRLIRRQPPRRIRIDTPLGTTTFEPRKDMSEEEIRAALRRLIEV
ncbi:MAG: hypothetical protein ACTHN7_04035 [Solirubrobacterales bacterium]